MTESEIIEALGNCNIELAFSVVKEMEQRGFWMKLTSPFHPGLPWYAGFTPHDTTGWNGTPDHVGQGDTLETAILLAALEAVAGDGHKSDGR